jgi:hypothetical protein
MIKLLLSALILALVGYVIIWYFDLRGTVTWVVYGCVVGIPLVLVPFITNKPAPDLTRILPILPASPPGSPPGSRRNSFGGKRRKYARNKSRS